MENSNTKNTLIILGVAALGTLAEVGIYFGGKKLAPLTSKLTSKIPGLDKLSKKVEIRKPAPKKTATKKSTVKRATKSKLEEKPTDKPKASE